MDFINTRAIYLPDIKYNSMPIFELRNGIFVCIEQEEIRYDLETVISDEDFIIVSIDIDEGTIENIRK